MTALNTAIYVQGKQDPWEIYHAAVQQILFYAGRDCSSEAIDYRLHSEEDGSEAIYISPHENLPVMMAIYYRPGRDLYTGEGAQAQLMSGCGDPQCATHRAQPAHLIVALATNFTWRADRLEGWNAGNLHSGMVWALGGFLDSKKVPWKWQENVSHATHEGYEDLDHLVKAAERFRSGFGAAGVAQQMARELMKRMGLLPEDE